MKKTLGRISCSLLFLVGIALSLHAQSYNSDKVSFTNFLVRMYNNAPFEGVRAVDDYDHAYLIGRL